MMAVDIGSTEQPGNNLIEMTADVVAAYVNHNSISVGDLPKLISDVHGALTALQAPAAAPVPELKPAVSVRKSVTPDFIICLEDGKKFKSLKRHLNTHYDMSPAQYREKWDLPSDYPMVAPNYSATRSRLARENGLGRKPTPKTTKRGGAVRAGA
jgi:predicted transcriptional regulator